MYLRLNIIVAYLAGFTISALTAMLIMVFVNISLLAFVAMVSIPSCFCWYSGLRNRGSMSILFVSSTIGWVAGTMLTAQVSMSPQGATKMIANSPLVGHEWILPCFVLSGIFAICGIILDPATKSPKTKKKPPDA